jgi:HIV-1 Vpr-binding protein
MLCRTPHTSMGLSLALFGLASLPLAFERTCALRAPVPAQLVSAALGLLAASSDAARKNAALFFDSAVHYPVLLESFDAAEGLHRLLFPLRAVAQLLQAGHVAELRAEKQVGCLGL